MEKWKSAVARAFCRTCFHTQNVIFNLQKNVEFSSEKRKYKNINVNKSGKLQPPKYPAALAFTQNVIFNLQSEVIG